MLRSRWLKMEDLRAQFSVGIIRRLGYDRLTGGGELRGAFYRQLILTSPSRFNETASLAPLRRLSSHANECWEPINSPPEQVVINK